jgi:hypothetical protein
MTARKLTVLLHNLEELDNNLRGRSEKDLSLATLLSVGHGLKAISEGRHARHLKIKC